MLGRTERKNSGELQRAAALVDPTQVEGNLVRVNAAKFISLVGLPANQTGIKILRSDKGASKVTHPILRRTRRSDTSPVLRLTFPANTTEETVKASLDTYGLSGYTVTQENGLFTASRADLKSISKDNTLDIKLSDDGLIATVQRQDGGLSQVAEKSAVAMVRVEFDSTKFTAEDVKRWQEENSVDGTLEEPQNPGQCYAVRRSDVPDTEETRRMTLEDGVEAVIVRADVMMVPDAFVCVVNETAYGSWGWGQLDFMAKMADKAFSSQMEDAIYSLRSVLEQIVIYSSLPLDVRKELTMRALGQFGDYVGTLMDSLPRQLLVSVVRSAKPLPENHSMTNETKSGSPTPTAAAPTGEAKPITRDDVVSILSEVLPGIVKTLMTPAAEATPVARTDETKTTPAPAVGLTREDVAAVIAEAIKPLVERVQGVEGTTLMRSATPDPATLTPKADDKPKDVFRNAIPGLRTASAGK